MNATGIKYKSKYKSKSDLINFKALFKNNFFYWLLENWLISSGEFAGNRYSFKQRPFLKQIAMDDSNYIIIQKSAQVGISELMIARMIWLLDSRRGNVLYIFPSQEQMRLFVTGRIKPALELNSYFFGKIESVFNTEQLRFRSIDNKVNTAYFSGARERRQMISKDVSNLFIDELDEMNMSNIYTLEKRLDASMKPTKFFFSTPTLPGIGINKKFTEDSDQKKWLVKCSFCSLEQELRFEDNILAFHDKPDKDARIRCSRCHNEITTEARLTGRWVAKASSGQPASGYHITKLMDTRFDANYFLNTYQDPTKIEEFYKSDLGEPYEPSGSKVSIEDINNSINPNFNMISRSSTYTYMGVDVGLKLHVVIRRPKGKSSLLIYACETTWDELPKLMRVYNVAACCIDMNPERTKAIEFQKKFPGKVFLCDYSSRDNLIKHSHADYYKLSLNRTYAMTLVIENFKNGKYILPADINIVVPEYAQQIRVPVRSVTEDANGDPIAHFPKTGRADHYFHAEVYCMIASHVAQRKVRFLERGLFY